MKVPGSAIASDGVRRYEAAEIVFISDPADAAVAGKLPRALL